MATFKVVPVPGQQRFSIVTNDGAGGESVGLWTFDTQAEAEVEVARLVAQDREDNDHRP
jgi:hypothetical protein